MIAKEPDISTMEYVKKWFVRHVPALAGAATSIFVDPIVGKLVAAGGDALVAEVQPQSWGVIQEPDIRTPSMVEYEQIYRRADGSERMDHLPLPIGSFIEDTLGGLYVARWRPSSLDNR